MSFEENIKKNNIILPNAADPVGAYVAAKHGGGGGDYIVMSSLPVT